MDAQEFRVIFWNVWSECQLDGRVSELCARIGRLIAEFEPDVFGFNEVVVDRQTGASALLSYLESHGYDTHFTPHGPESGRWVVGSALASRRQVMRIDEPALGPDSGAARRGYPGWQVRAIDADVLAADGRVVRVIVTHWAHLVPPNWLTHWVHAREFRRLLGVRGLGQRVVIGGDFNELKIMPAIRGLGREFHRATGTFGQPTWRWHGKKRRLLRANYDNILWSRGGTLDLRKFAVLPFAPSDHAPLLAQFGLQRLTTRRG